MRSVAMLLVLVTACAENPFAGWTDRTDPHDLLRPRIKAMPGSYEGVDDEDFVPIRSVSTSLNRQPASTNFAWTPGNTINVQLYWGNYNDDADVYATGYRFATDGRIMVGEPMAKTMIGSSVVSFELPVDACAGISARCLQLPFEQYLVLSAKYGDGELSVLPYAQATVSIMCGTCSGSDCEQAPEC